MKRYNKKHVYTIDGESVVVHFKSRLVEVPTTPPISKRQAESVARLVGGIITKGTVMLLQRRGYVLGLSQEDKGGTYFKLLSARHPAGIEE